MGGATGMLRWLGIGAVALGLLGASAGAAQTYAASSARGLAEADVARLRSNGYREASFNLAIGCVIGVPLLLAARRRRRRESAQSASGSTPS